MNTLWVPLANKDLFWLHIPKGHCLITKSCYGQNQYFEKIYVTFNTEFFLSTSENSWIYQYISYTSLYCQKKGTYYCVIMTKTGTLTNNNNMKIKE